MEHFRNLGLLFFSRRISTWFMVPEEMLGFDN
jgi:hypothetical protein